MAMRAKTPEYGEGFYPARDFKRISELLDYLDLVRPGSVPQAVHSDVDASREAGKTEPEQLRAAIIATAERRQQLRAELEMLDSTLVHLLIERATAPEYGAGMTQLELTQVFRINKNTITDSRFDPLELPPPPAA